ncbi:hypothetical protein SMICM304S_03928 [Streptomyces microflavus]
MGGALLAAMLCVLASGTPKAAVVSTVVFLVGNRFGWALSTNGLPSFYVTGLQTAAVIGLTMVLADAHALTGVRRRAWPRRTWCCSCRSCRW